MEGKDSEERSEKKRLADSQKRTNPLKGRPGAQAQDRTNRRNICSICFASGCKDKDNHKDFLKGHLDKDHMDTPRAKVREDLR